MPVTIRPSPEKVGQNNDMTFESEEALFSRLVRAWEARHDLPESESRANKPILHSSFRGSLAPSSIVPYGNGFVNGVIRAFQQDLHLVLRPDDVWLAITTQFSFYVTTAHAEELRARYCQA
jgi:hypothetical protein